MRLKITLVILLFLSLAASAQNLPTAVVYGKVVDEQNHPIEMANVVVTELLVGQSTNSRGAYELNLLSDTTLVISFSFVGFESKQVTVRLAQGERRKLDVVLCSHSTNLPDITISDRGIDASSLTRLDAKQATLLPTMGGGIENLI